MRAAAALLALMVATPASAKCVTAAEAPDAVRVILGPAAAVGTMPAWLVPALAEQTAGLPGVAADPVGFVAAVTATGIFLFPVTRDGLCDGTPGHVSVENTPAFLGLIREWMRDRGYTKERVA